MKDRYNDIMIEFYNNVDPRRKQELADGRMIQEDHKAMANLSETAIYHEFNPDRFVEKFQNYDQNTKKYKS
jgi:hypothetical protein